MCLTKFLCATNLIFIYLWIYSNEQLTSDQSLWSQWKRPWPKSTSSSDARERSVDKYTRVINVIDPKPFANRRN